MKLFSRIRFFRSPVTRVVLLAIFSSPIAGLSEGQDSQPSIERGALVFEQRCAICHGQYGFGEGLLAMKIEGYPNTNLMSDIKAKTRNEVHSVVSFGLKQKGISKFMPPMGDALTWTEMESVVDFVMTMRENPKQARELASAVVANTKSSLREGITIFETRCTLCHGISGEGNGRMSKIIKTPPPYDLTKSIVPDPYLKMIIEKGGEGVGRSAQMPPWSDQLTNNQVDSVILYIKTLRE